jgi:very-short-patch-repair endonuclease
MGGAGEGDQQESSHRHRTERAMEEERIEAHPFAQKLRRKMRAAEGALWEHLKCRRLDGYKFRTQQPIEPYTVDFYCAHLRLCIEVDGEYHADRLELDQAKDEFLRSLNLTVVRFSNHEALNNTEDVVKRLRNLCGSLGQYRY